MRNKEYIGTIVVIAVLSLLLFCGMVRGQDVSSDRVVDKIEVVGEFTYKYCLNECGIAFNHYIENAMVMLRNDCIADYGCATCMDECAEEFLKNNKELYNSMIKNTVRPDI